jgi:hypothetical protein
MAMHAGEIAKLPHVDLQNLRAGATKRDIFLSKSDSKSVHGWKDFAIQ